MDVPAKTLLIAYRTTVLLNKQEKFTIYRVPIYQQNLKSSTHHKLIMQNSITSLMTLYNH